MTWGPQVGSDGRVRVAQDSVTGLWGIVVADSTASTPCCCGNPCDGCGGDQPDLIVTGADTVPGQFDPNGSYTFTSFENAPGGYAIANGNASCRWTWTYVDLFGNTSTIVLYRVDTVEGLPVTPFFVTVASTNFVGGYNWAYQGTNSGEDFNGDNPDISCVDGVLTGTTFLREAEGDPTGPFATGTLG